jgi:hypothetical protein
MLNWMLKLINKTKESDVIEIKPKLKKLYYITYASEFLGTISARTRPEATRKALAKFGRNIIKNTYDLEVVDSGKTE